MYCIELRPAVWLCDKEFPRNGVLCLEVFNHRYLPNKARGGWTDRLSKVHLRTVLFGAGSRNTVRAYAV